MRWGALRAKDFDVEYELTSSSFFRNSLVAIDQLGEMLRDVTVATLTGYAPTVGSQNLQASAHYHSGSSSSTVHVMQVCTD